MINLWFPTLTATGESQGPLRSASDLFFPKETFVVAWAIVEIGDLHSGDIQVSHPWFQTLAALLKEDFQPEYFLWGLASCFQPQIQKQIEKGLEHQHAVSQNVSDLEASIPCQHHR